MFLFSGVGIFLSIERDPIAAQFLPLFRECLRIRKNIVLKFLFVFVKLRGSLAVCCFVAGWATNTQIGVHFSPTHHFLKLLCFLLLSTSKLLNARPLYTLPHHFPSQSLLLVLTNAFFCCFRHHISPYPFLPAEATSIHFPRRHPFFLPLPLLLASELILYTHQHIHIQRYTHTNTFIY